MAENGSLQYACNRHQQVPRPQWTMEVQVEDSNGELYNNGEYLAQDALKH